MDGNQQRELSLYVLGDMDFPNCAEQIQHLSFAEMQEWSGVGYDDSHDFGTDFCRRAQAMSSRWNRSNSSNR